MSKERIQGYLDTIVANYEPGGTYWGVPFEEYTKEELIAIIVTMGETMRKQWADLNVYEKAHAYEKAMK